MYIAQPRHNNEISIVFIHLKLTVRINTDDLFFLDFDLSWLQFLFKIDALALNNHFLFPFLMTIS